MLFQKIFSLRLISLFAVVSFVTLTVIPPSYAQVVAPMPVPGSMVSSSIDHQPTTLKGMIIDPDEALKFEFIVDHGQDELAVDVLEQETHKLVQYFLAALATPEEDMWVNLSPEEKDRIIPDHFGQTQMGRDLLAQDYFLKQLTASLLYPEDDLGKSFWDKVYAQAQERYGTTEIPIDTFNKVWIVPQKAVVYEHGQTVFVMDQHLKVMLEKDYLLEKNTSERVDSGADEISRQVIREVIIPAIEKEVNEGSHFANLRQIYSSVILASWYKQNLQESFLGQLYVDQSKTQGIEIENSIEQRNKIYQQYVEAFRKGAFELIKEDYDQTSGEIVPRKYISGGAEMAMVTRGVLTVVTALTGLLLSAESALSRSKGLTRAGLEFKTAWGDVQNVADNQGLSDFHATAIESGLDPKDASIEELKNVVEDGSVVFISYERDGKVQKGFVKEVRSFGGTYTVIVSQKDGQGKLRDYDLSGNGIETLSKIGVDSVNEPRAEDLYLGAYLSYSDNGVKHYGQVVKVEEIANVGDVETQSVAVDVIRYEVSAKGELKEIAQRVVLADSTNAIASYGIKLALTLEGLNPEFELATLPTVGDLHEAFEDGKVILGTYQLSDGRQVPVRVMQYVQHNLPLLKQKDRRQSITYALLPLQVAVSMDSSLKEWRDMNSQRRRGDLLDSANPDPSLWTLVGENTDKLINQGGLSDIRVIEVNGEGEGGVGKLSSVSSSVDNRFDSAGPQQPVFISAAKDLIEYTSMKSPTYTKIKAAVKNAGKGGFVLIDGKYKVKSGAVKKDGSGFKLVVTSVDGEETLYFSEGVKDVISNKVEVAKNLGKDDQGMNAGYGGIDFDMSMISQWDVKSDAQGLKFPAPKATEELNISLPGLVAQINYMNDLLIVDLNTLLGLTGR